MDSIMAGIASALALLLFLVGLIVWVSAQLLPSETTAHKTADRLSLPCQEVK